MGSLEEVSPGHILQARSEGLGFYSKCSGRALKPKGSKQG